MATNQSNAFVSNILNSGGKPMSSSQLLQQASLSTTPAKTTSTTTTSQPPQTVTRSLAHHSSSASSNAFVSQVLNPEQKTATQVLNQASLSTPAPVNPSTLGLKDNVAEITGKPTMIQPVQPTTQTQQNTAQKLYNAVTSVPSYYGNKVEPALVSTVQKGVDNSLYGKYLAGQTIGYTSTHPQYRGSVGGRPLYNGEQIQSFNLKNNYDNSFYQYQSTPGGNKVDLPVDIGKTPIKTPSSKQIAEATPALIKTGALVGATVAQPELVGLTLGGLTTAKGVYDFFNTDIPTYSEKTINDFTPGFTDEQRQELLKTKQGQKLLDDIKNYNDEQKNNIQIANRNKGLALVETIAGAAILADTGISWFNKPVLNIFKPTLPEATFSVEQASLEGTGKNLYRYTVKQEVPSMEARLTTKGRDFFGMKPIVEGAITKPNTYSTSTIGLRELNQLPGKGFVLEGEPFAISTIRQGSSYAKVSTVDYLGQKITPEAISLLPKNQQYLFGETISKGLAEGRPINKNLLPDIVGQDKQLARVLSIENPKVRVSLADEGGLAFKSIPGNKDRLITTSASIVEENPSKMGFDYQEYKAKIGSKTTKSNPNSMKSTGNVRMGSGIIKVYDPITPTFNLDTFDITSSNVDSGLRVYQGTTKENAENILKTGLKTGQQAGKYYGIAKPLDYAYVTVDQSAAKGYAVRAALKSGSQPEVITGVIPRDRAIELLKGQGGPGLKGEIKLGNPEVVEQIQLVRNKPSTDIPIVYPKANYPSINKITSLTKDNLNRPPIPFIFQQRLGQQTNLIQPKLLTVQTQPSKQSFFTSDVESIKQQSLQNVVSIDTTKTSSSNKIKDIVVPSIKTTQILSQPSTQSSKEMQGLVQSQALRQTQITKQTFGKINITQIITPNNPDFPNPPRSTKIRFKIDQEKPKLLKLNNKVKSKKGFIVEVRRKGKFKAISGSLPLGKALATGSKKVTDTLAATFRLRPGKSTLDSDINYSVNRSIFNPPKSKKAQPLTFVQRTNAPGGGRLASIGERIEIINAKRAGSFIK